MIFGKLDEKGLHLAPKKIKNGDSITYNPPAETLLPLGYLPVIFTDPPVVEEGYEAVSTWTQTETEIIQGWDVVVVEPTAEELLAILLGDEA